VGIGQGTRIERAIIDKNARIGQGVTIRSHAGEEDRDEDQYSIRDGIVVIPKNATVPDGSTI
jgi:glucose-1-phosphate adenylyltransferase